jgi:hypothetical protein
MNVVVPLAGPDFERPDGSVKAMMPIDGQPLLRLAFESRPWCDDISDLIFVLRDLPASRAFAQDQLARWYPSARCVWLSRGAGGAALSAAAGAALIQDPEEPLVVDLCDIMFRSDLDPVRRFADDRRLGGLAVTFASALPQYSYLELGPDGTMLRAREKIVISSHASAGVYAFRDSAMFWGALAHSLRHRTELAHKGALFVCPMLNGVVAQGWDVRAAPADSARDIK